MRFSVILSDPPWHYNNRKTGGERCNKTKFGGGAQKHYPLMRDKDLISLAPAVQGIAADNCAHFMWATYPRLDFAMDLLKAWGFRWATVAFTWVKRNKADTSEIYGPGYYTASNPEICLLGIRGKMRPTRKMTPSVIVCPRMEHSRKPDLHPLIEAMYPDLAGIEMFARARREGWSAVGNEVSGFSVERDLQILAGAPPDNGGRDVREQLPL